MPRGPVGRGATGVFVCLLVSAPKRTCFVDSQSRQLTQHLTTSDFLIQRSAEQIDETSRRLAAKTALSEDASKNKGRYLLATKGFDAEKLAQNLNSISLKSTFEPLEPLGDTDLESYLRTEHDNMVLTAIQEAKKETVDNFRHTFTSSMEADWESTKHVLLGALTNKQTKTPVAPRPTGPRGMPVDPTRRTKTTDEQLRYLRVVEKLREHLGTKTPLALCRLFGAVDTRRPEIRASWLMLSSLLGDKGTLTEGVFRERYLTQDPGLKRELMDSMRRHYEQAYIKFMKETIQFQPTIAQIGGEHNILSTVRGYCGIKVDAHKTRYLEMTAKGEAPWPIIYYCLRAGEPGAVQKFIASQQLETMVQPFSSLLNDYINHKPNLDNQRSTQVRHILRSSPDPYKKAAYNIVTKLESQHTSELTDSIEDWLWYRLSLMNGQEGLVALQKALSNEAGGHHRTPTNNFIIMLTLQHFEDAVGYLYECEGYQVAAVHMAIALNFYGLLRRPQDCGSGMKADQRIRSQDDQGNSVLNVDLILRKYIFEVTMWEGDDALAYLCLITEEPAKIEALAHLILTTRNIDLFVGSILPGGRRKDGLLPHCLPRPVVNAVAETAAIQSEKQGDYLDAIRLHDLVNNQAAAVELINSRLSQLLTQSGPARQAVLDVISTLNINFTDPRVSQKAIGTLRRLRALAAFFDAYQTNHYYDALRQLETIDLLPLDTGDVGRRVGEFNDLEPAIRRNMGEILMAATLTIYALFKSLQNKAPSAIGEQEKHLLRSKVRAVVAYAGSIPYQTPNLNTLIRLEVAMT
eukprot:TRINITY_DN5517_c0_g1_i2.p1 TRINITY_DN5517_c0_g1~~TRINITY_DN5517_c0_g1_i2.p1  ORF type:complete len:803 (-),score=83.30 TRINITY_DN5517_c0_g1_i2:135-2543(-)